MGPELVLLKGTIRAPCLCLPDRAWPATDVDAWVRKVIAASAEMEVYWNNIVTKGVSVRKPAHELIKTVRDIRQDTAGDGDQ